MDFHGFNLSSWITDKSAFHCRLDTPALNNSQNNHDNRDNQKNVNESADCVRGNQAQYPEDD